MRVDFRSLNKKLLESLIKVGGFDFENPNRASILARMESAIAQASGAARDKQKGQASLFDAMETSAAPAHAVKNNRAIPPDWPLRERLRFERELLGIYISGHPIDEFEANLRAFRSLNLGEAEHQANGLVRIAGVIVSIDVRTTQRDKRPYARLQLEDTTGRMEVMVFPDLYQTLGPLLEEGLPLVVSGEFELDDEGSSRFRPSEILLLKQALEQLVTEVRILLKSHETSPTLFPKILELTSQAPGQLPLCFLIQDAQNHSALLEADTRFYVRPTLQLLHQLRELVGSANIQLGAKAITPPRRRQWQKKPILTS